jgi:hypothetical protein
MTGGSCATDSAGRPSAFYFTFSFIIYNNIIPACLPSGVRGINPVRDDIIIEKNKKNK